MTATPHTHTRRRTLLAATAASAGTLALAACGDDSDDSDDTGAENGDNGNDDAAPQDPEGPGGALAALADVPVGEATAATTPDGDDALLFRADEATVAAFSAVCTHQGCGVQPAGAELHCPCHNSVFDAATGEVLSGPADEPLPAIRVRIEGQRIVQE
ncbi:Rieske (2Fe-2S) protein [Streptomyces johnsoniae]|uniref:Cytochrome bc1 complex Rieske iron-sulfur subunit n=1 Tax=Streptomyces johnsoniae TaxID=3075532 RepID=A0ABU2SA52_9ACTN|nr:Rieske (2Fe-2S) protein [Streptomyces sp. DSM 41886]MDT0445857.1 Rieske (2Fe-2S) protein [Streptomyces sp. DSM 41886]